jgi:hypothetical protein
MANGTHETNRHGNGEKKLAFKPRKTSTEIKPDAPEGEWEAQIPKGKCKMLITQKGDPRLIVPFKLLTAADEKNESFQGSEVSLSIIIFDDEDATKRRGANMMKQRLRSLCTALDIDMGEVYPTEVTSEEDFRPLFDALEGQKLTIWTVHSKRIAESGEELTDTDVRFAKPGAGLVTKSKEEEEEEEEAPRKVQKGGKARR